jgi:hypothetical protein
MLIELWRDATVREGFAHGRSLKEISDETGLSEDDVLRRELELHLIVQLPDAAADEGQHNSTAALNARI